MRIIFDSIKKQWLVACSLDDYKSEETCDRLMAIQLIERGWPVVIR